MKHSKASSRGADARQRAPLRHAALLAVVWGCVGGSHLQAQQEYLYTASYRDADVRTVAEQVQQVIGRPIILDPRLLARVTILSNAPMTADAFYRTFVAALEVHGFTARESGNAIMIVPIDTTQPQRIQENRE